MDQRRSAVVTGGTKGIGRAIVERLASAGYHIAVCARTESDLRDLQEELTARHGDVQVHVMATDLSIRDEVRAFSKFVGRQWSSVDVLVNNAGLFVPGEILEEEEGVLEDTIATNLYSSYYLTRDLFPLISESNNAHIFNVCSVASLIAYPNGGSYSISKFAQLGFSKVLREELKPKGIKVTAVIPGATWSHSWKGADYPEDRLMQPEDIAEAVMSALSMQPSAVVEEIIIRPQLGDL